MPSNCTNLYTRITAQIIEALDADIRPWFQPWCAGYAAGAITRPVRANNVPYRGINVVMLWLRASLNGYECPTWMTYRQAKELGGQVRGGEKGTTVVYRDSFVRPTADENGETNEECVPFLKSYTVFNAEQIDGLPDRFFATVQPQVTVIERIERVEEFVERTHATVHYGESHAHYAPSADVIGMPTAELFRDAESLYATLLHELTHWSRHSSRLDRDFGGLRFGDQGYAMEELVAEIGAAFLCADLGINTEVRDDHVSYISSWLNVLRKDHKAIFTAAAHAEQAAGYLHGLQRPDTDDGVCHAA